MSLSDVDTRLPSPNRGLLNDEFDAFAGDVGPPLPFADLQATPAAHNIADRAADAAANELNAAAFGQEFMAFERELRENDAANRPAAQAAAEPPQQQQETPTTTFRRHLLETLCEINAAAAAAAAAPGQLPVGRCVVLATAGRCWVAAPGERARVLQNRNQPRENVPVPPTPTPAVYQMFRNSEKVGSLYDQRLVIAHPRGIVLQRPGEHFHVYPVKYSAIERYFKNLTAKNNAAELEVWNWTSISAALTTIAITVISAPQEVWEESCTSIANADNPNAKFVAINATRTVDPATTVFSFHIFHNSSLPPLDHVIVAPHARGGDIAMPPTTWSWPSSHW